jgi:hypothetical protein
VRAPPQSPYTQTGGLCRFASSIPPRAWCVICCTTKAETSCQCSARRSALRPALVSPHGLTVTSGLVESTRPCPHLRQSAVAIVYALGIHCWTIKDWYFRGKTNLECGFAQKDKRTGVPWTGQCKTWYHHIRAQNVYPAGSRSNVSTRVENDNFYGSVR